MIIGAMIEIQLRLSGRKYLSKSELDTTEIELKAIAKPANSGFKTRPQAINTRAAIGIPMTL